MIVIYKWNYKSVIYKWNYKCIYKLSGANDITAIGANPVKLFYESKLQFHNPVNQKLQSYISHFNSGQNLKSKMLIKVELYLVLPDKVYLRWQW